MARASKHWVCMRAMALVLAATSASAANIYKCKTRDGGVMRLQTLIEDVTAYVEAKISENKLVDSAEAHDTARIIAVANYYDRFINPCEQNWVKTKKEAVKELNNIAGTVLDPEVVKAFITALG